MTKNLFILFFSLLPWLAAAQDAGADNMREPRGGEKIRAAHAAYVTQRIGLTSAEAEKFWPVYREYSEKRRAIRGKMWEARRSQKSQEEILQLDLKLKQEELDLEKEYTGKFGKIIPADKLVKLRQAELDFRKLLLKQIQQQRRPRR